MKRTYEGLIRALAEKASTFIAEYQNVCAVQNVSFVFSREAGFVSRELAFRWHRIVCRIKFYSRTSTCLKPCAESDNRSVGEIFSCCSLAFLSGLFSEFRHTLL